MISNKIIKPSKLQLDISKAFISTDNNIVVNAVPGSGKTTLILLLIQSIPPTKKAIYLAFNKEIVESTKKKIPKHQKNITVSTLHSLGMSTIFRNSNCKIEVDYYKTVKIFFELNDRIWKESSKRLTFSAFIVSELYDIYRLNMLQSIEEVKSVALQQNIEFLDEDIDRLKDLIFYMETYNNIESKSKKMVDFVDMLYLPIKLKLVMNKYDEVLIDECQDLSKIQQKIVQKILSSKGRFVAVGDRNQCIYGFIGSDKESFDNFLSYPKTLNMPLSITYRCAKNITKYANSVYNTMKAHDNLEEGEVRNGSVFEIQKGDFVLCRNNAPLVELFLFLLTQHKRAIIKGKDLGDALKSLLKPLKEDDDIGFYFETICNKLISDLEAKGIAEPKKTGRYRSLLEKINILNLLLKSFKSLQSLKDCINKLFVEDVDENSIILSTIHKSKGLEADNVFILAPELIPSIWAEKPHEIEQEENLRYVAYTRAKKKLIIIEDFKSYNQKEEVDE